MKKLLAEEMSKETESKRRAPSVIARLMGLDGMPLHHPASKQHKGSPENCLHRGMQLENTHGSRLYDGRSSRRSSKDQQEFKDVFEVSEIPKVESRRYTSQCADLMTTDAEISFIEQKFMDAKRLATDRDSLSSKEFDDALEVLDSNTDLLLKYFQRPDSLFKKHLNDLQATPILSHCGHIEAMISSDREKYERGDLSWKSARDSKQLSVNRTHHKHHDGYPGQFDRRHVLCNAPKSPEFEVNGKDEQPAAPTRIVVLKPNLAKLQHATKFVSSPCSSHAFLSEGGKSAAFPDIRNRGVELHEKKRQPDNMGFSMQNSAESREIAKEITRQMKNSLYAGSTIFSSSRFRGYAGDDSSCDFSWYESAEESEVTAVTNSVDLNNRSRPSSRASESSVSREAKKRLSERWKMTHKPQQVQAIHRGSTLAEMLAIPANETKESNFESMSVGEALHNKLAGNGKHAGSVEPLGISSRDGWKDGSIGSLSRSRSLPASCTGFGSPRTHVDRFMMPKEALKRERRKASKGSYQQGVNIKTSKSGHKKSWSSHYTNMENFESSPDIDTIQDKLKINPEENLSKQEVPPSYSLNENLRDTSVVTEDLVDAALENAAGSSEIPDSDLPELSSCVLIKGNTSIVDEESLLQQVNFLAFPVDIHTFEFSP